MNSIQSLPKRKPELARKKLEFDFAPLVVDRPEHLSMGAWFLSIVHAICWQIEPHFFFVVYGRRACRLPHCFLWSVSFLSSFSSPTWLDLLWSSYPLENKAISQHYLLYYYKYLDPTKFQLNFWSTRTMMDVYLI